MPQFTVYRNPNPATKTALPLLLDVQSDLMTGLATRVVVPLCPASAMKGKRINTLMPELTVGDRDYVMLTPQLAGVRQQSIGAPLADLSGSRVEIIAALDLLITGF
jgi:toxin CcdB